MTSTRTRLLTVARRAAATAATAAVLAGCTASRGTGPQPAATTGPSARATSATATPASTEATARLAVEQAYARFWPVAWDIDKNPQPRWRPLLAAVATDPVLTRLLSTAGIQTRQRITRYGMVTPHVVSVRFVGADRASLVDCQDASHAGQADRRTGTRKTVGVARSPVAATLVGAPDGSWRVADVRYTGGTC